MSLVLCIYTEYVFVCILLKSWRILASLEMQTNSDIYPMFGMYEMGFK